MNHNYIIADAIKHSDELAFELFFSMEFNNVVHFVQSYLNDIHVAKDIAQESFISFWNKRENINPELSIRTYIFTIARNKALNFIRDNRLKLKNSITSDDYNLYFYALSHYSITERIDALEMEKLISRTFDQLPNKIQRIFTMSRKFGLSYKEIAKKEDISVKAVEYQIKKTLVLFKKKLRNYTTFFLFFYIFFLGFAITIV